MMADIKAISMGFYAEKIGDYNILHVATTHSWWYWIAVIGLVWIVASLGIGLFVAWFIQKGRGEVWRNREDAKRREMDEEESGQGKE